MRRRFSPSVLRQVVGAPRNDGKTEPPRQHYSDNIKTMLIITPKKTVPSWGRLRYALVVGLVYLAIPGLARAQTARDSALYLRAQQMVANGDAVAGRKLADSVAAAAPVGSPAFAEGLYWRATLADNARESEYDYRRIIVDYPLSGRVADALLRIGQLESARGENAAALQHFQRLVLEHPESPLHADGSYWMARMYFDANDATRACTANADALASVPASNVELKNRIAFQQQRCRGVALAVNPAPAPVTTPTKRAAVAEASEAATARTEAKVAPKVAVPATAATVADRRDRDSVAPARANAGEEAGANPVSRAPTREEVERALASAKQSEIAKAAMARTERERAASAAKQVAERAPARPDATPSPRVEESGAGSGRYAVQVAAFRTRAPATQLVAKLRGRGYNAYVDGTRAPYRVRIGHYPTNADAVSALTRLKARKIDGFVVER